MSIHDISEARWLIEVAGVPGTFQTKTGGATGVEHTKSRDGGQLKPRIYQGPPNTDDLTVSRDFQVPRDEEVRRALQARLNSGQRFTAVITCRPLSETMGAVGQPHVYEGVLQKVTPPEGNANSGQPSKLELVFTISEAR